MIKKKLHTIMHPVFGLIAGVSPLKKVDRLTTEEDFARFDAECRRDASYNMSRDSASAHELLGLLHRAQDLIYHMGKRVCLEGTLGQMAEEFWKDSNPWIDVPFDGAMPKAVPDERDNRIKELEEAVWRRNQQIGVACLKHDLVHSLACGRCYDELLSAALELQDCVENFAGLTVSGYPVPPVRGEGACACNGCDRKRKALGTVTEHGARRALNLVHGNNRSGQEGSGDGGQG